MSRPPRQPELGNWVLDFWWLLDGPRLQARGLSSLHINNLSLNVCSPDSFPASLAIISHTDTTILGTLSIVI